MPFLTVLSSLYPARRLAPLLALTALVAACGAGIEATERSDGGGPSEAVEILVIGDWGVGRDSAELVAEAVRRFEATEHADLLVTVGDNFYGHLVEDFHELWRKYYGWVEKERITVAGSLGNHDVRVDRGRFQFKTLGMPGPYYRLRAENVELFVLDSTDVNAKQTRWLEQALASSRARWKIPVFHHPRYTCGRYAHDGGRVAEWSPLFERYGVQLVLTGHDHNYQRFQSDEITYVVAGGGGASLYEVEECPPGHPPLVAAHSLHGFLYLEADTEELRGVAITASGAQIDSFLLLPPGGPGAS